MLQVPSTSQDQLQDQYDDMIQIHDGKWDEDGSRSVSCGSDVYNNTVQAGLYTASSRSPVLVPILCRGVGVR